MGNMHMKTAQRYSSLGLSNQNCKEIHTLGLLNLREKKDSNRCWQRRRKPGALMPHWWKCISGVATLGNSLVVPRNAKPGGTT